MDPTATLKEIRTLLARYRENELLTDEEGDRLCELVAALDGWLSKGGGFPEPWKLKPVCQWCGRVGAQKSFDFWNGKPQCRGRDACFERSRKK
jgi:hypothetical protein